MSKKGSAQGTHKAAPEPQEVAGPKMGAHPGNAAAVVQVLRIVAGRFYVSAQQVDILAELVDDIKSKVCVCERGPKLRGPTHGVPTTYFLLAEHLSTLDCYATAVADQVRW